MINYYLLTKPGIVMGNLFTFAAGIFARFKRECSISRYFLPPFWALAFIMASACVFNNYIDRQLDQKMERTKNRALVTGLISGKNAILFAVLLGILRFSDFVFLHQSFDPICRSLGFFVYVVLYSLWKSRTIYGTAIGSIAGAVPLSSAIAR